MTDKNYHSICEEIVLRVTETERLSIESDPASESILRESWKSNVVAYLKAYLGVFYLLLRRFDERVRYFFESFRYSELIEFLDKDEVLVFGGRDVLSAPKKEKLTCFWLFGLQAAIVIGLRDRHLLALSLYIKVLRIKLSGHRRYIFLYDDVLPHGVFFSEFAKAYNHTTIMIQHGYPPNAEEVYLREGLSCDFNLVYDRQGIEEGIDKSSCYEIGIPLQLRPLTKFVRTVILVGTGLSGIKPEAYKTSLVVYQNIVRQIEKSDLSWRVSYRPHPNETNENYAAFFQSIDKSEKRDCLSDNKKVFIGYESTLLYEAFTAGHHAINLTHQAKCDIRYQPSVTLDEDQIDLIPQIIADNIESIESIDTKLAPDLQSRFNAAVVDILGKTSNQVNGS